MELSYCSYLNHPGSVLTKLGVPSNKKKEEKMKEKNKNKATETTEKDEETYTCHILSIFCILFYIFNDKASIIVFWT